MIYKAIGFDYGGVIGGVTTGGRDFNARVIELLGIDEDTYKRVYHSLNHMINLGEVTTWREFWTIFLEEVGKPEKLNELMIVNDESINNLSVIDPRMLPLIDKLRSSGYKVGLLSNTTTEGGSDMRRQGIDSHFDVFHISVETQLMKPDPNAFKNLANDMGVGTDELIFIDDSVKSLSTAEECGYTPVLFENYLQLVERLGQLGVHV